MKITTQFLKKHHACDNGVEWVTEQKLIGLEAVPFLKKLIEGDQLLWANWLIVRVMNYKQYVSYAVFASEQVIDIYEKKHPNDKRPREAIEAAKKCIDDPSAKNKKAAADAAADAAAAADVAYDAAAAAAAAADADAAYDAAYDAADVAADVAAYDAAYDAADVADAYAYARKEMRLRILKYGIGLLIK